MTAALTIAPAANTIIRMNNSENSPLAIALFALILTLGAACGVGGGADLRALVRRQRPKPAQKGGQLAPLSEKRHAPLVQRVRIRRRFQLRKRPRRQLIDPRDARRFAHFGYRSLPASKRNYSYAVG